MIRYPAGDLLIFQFENLARDPQLVHAIPGRLADPVRFPRGLDLSFATSPREEDVVAARTALCTAIGLKLENVVVPRQVHGNKVAAVGAGDRGRGALTRESGIADTDAVTTDCGGVGLFVTAADCVPLLFFDPKRRAIGLAHAGWRGTVERIGSATVKHMAHSYGSSPADLIVGIGPSIGPCCYTVGEDVISEVEASYGATTADLVTDTGGNRRLNLWRANEVDLLDAGITAANLEVAGMCTACNTELFFSHRIEQERGGRFGAIMALRAQGM